MKEDDEEKEDREMRVLFNKSKNMDIPCPGFLYSAASKQALAAFSNPREALKMVFGMHSIRVFSKVSLDPYYEPW